MDHPKAPLKPKDQPGRPAPSLAIPSRPIIKPDITPTAPEPPRAEHIPVAAKTIPAPEPQPHIEPPSELARPTESASTPPADTVKSEEVTRQDVRRERELQEYINSHKFYVPINATARKRSLQISFGLLVFLILLAVVLIDLLLDSGMILLLQKVPHTHFFDLQP